MTVIDAEGIKDPGHELRVAAHVVPEPGGVGGTLAIAELDGVSPHDQLTLEIDLEGRGGGLWNLLNGLSQDMNRREKKFEMCALKKNRTKISNSTMEPLEVHPG